MTEKSGRAEVVLCWGLVAAGPGILLPGILGAFCLLDGAPKLGVG